MVAGNGGSAALAQHLAAELMVRYQRDRRPLPALALTADSAVLTAAANDYAFEYVFARQVEALGQPGDALILLTTSGRSPNLLRAAVTAQRAGVAVVALLGPEPCELERVADLAVRFAGPSVPTIQEQHLAAIHEICGLIEEEAWG